VGTKLIYTVSKIMPYFKRAPLSVVQLRDAAGITESTARRLIRKAIADGFLEEIGNTNLYAIPEVPHPDDVPRRMKTAVGETPLDSGLVRMRELAKVGPVNPYTQLLWAGERA
jgi:hypothetical protein